MSVHLKISSSLPEGSQGKPSHRDLLMEMAQFAKPDMKKGLALFVIDFAIYWTALAGVLFLPGLPLKLLASLVAGIKMANLATLAHDAAHNALTPSRRLNWWIGVLAFMPGLFNLRLWIYDHHVLHHPHTNGAHVDSYQPLSKADYDAMSAPMRAWHRFVRSGNPLSFGLYYIIQRWSQVKCVPGDFLPAAHRKSAWQHTAFLAAYFLVFATMLTLAPSFAPVSSAEALLLGFALPFFMLQSLLGASLYINHTHPDIPWRNHTSPMAGKLSAEAITLHLRLPKVLASLTHHFFEHPAHHLYPGIPCYELGKAQARLDQLLGARAVVIDFSFAALADIFRKCKLYDYQNHRWLDFDGKPTTETARAILEVQFQTAHI